MQLATSLLKDQLNVAYSRHALLVVEDEQRLASGLKRGLEAEGYAADVALNGTDGLWMARNMPYDAIVLDIMLPG